MIRVSPRFAKLQTCALLAATLLAVGAPAAPAELQPAPPLSATLLDGSPFDLAELRGKVVVVNFWASWCTPCREEMPALDAFYQRHRERGLRLIAISLDRAADAAKARQIAGQFSFPAALASQSRYKGYGRIRRLPITFVIDREGNLRQDITAGVAKVDLAFLEERIAPLLGP